MPVRYRIALLVSILSALFLSPGPARAESAQPTENAAATPIDTPPSGSTPVTGEDAGKNPQKEGFLAGLWNSMTDEAHVTLGYGTLEVKLDIRRKSDGASATMVQRDTSSVFLNYGSRPFFFKDSGFGYTFMINYVGFDMGQQEIYKDTYVNLGTDVRGQLFYAVPVLFYQWGEHRHKGKFVRLGFGAGVGAATYSGTIQLTGSQNPDERIYTVNNSYTPRFALSNFLEARWNHFGVSISYASPRIYGDEYDIKVSNFTAHLGYVIYF